MTSDLLFYVNGKKVVEKNVEPETTLLQYLRLKLGLTGTKLGCGEGGCGACTVMVSRHNRDKARTEHYTVNACLAPVCSLHGMAVTTVEGIGSVEKGLHPVQERLAKSHGSQCGFCTPGIIMSMYTLLRNEPQPSIEHMEKAFEGNLCRCTGYRPILDAFRTFTKEFCAMGENCCKNESNKGEEKKVVDELVSKSEFIPLDPSQEPIFPPELQMNCGVYDSASKVYKGERVTWYRPVTLEELLKLKATYPDARPVIGNTEIGVEMKFKNKHYPVMIAATHIPELLRIQHKDKGITFGASVTLSTLDTELKAALQIYPEHQTRVFSAVIEMLRWFAGYQIRNVAAIAGNIITASPISDLNPLFLACGAKLRVLSKENGSKDIVMDKSFFLDYRKTAVKTGEVIESITLPFTTKVHARWVPRLLKSHEKERRVRESRAFLARHKKEGDAFLSRIITTDETWLWFYDPETKSQSAVWKHSDSPPPKKARVSKCGGKYMFIMFADMEGMILNHAVPSNTTVNADYYSKNEYLCGYKQAHRREDDIAIVNAGMLVRFKEGTNVVEKLLLAYGGMAITTVMPTNAMKVAAGRCWDDSLVSDMCRLLGEDLPLDPEAPGGMTEYRRTLTTSFFFKFYLTVLLQLQAQPIECKSSVSPYCKSAIARFHREPSKSVQTYEHVDPEKVEGRDPVGQPLAHLSAMKQVTGQAIYVDDMPRFQNELYLAFVRSSKAYANIVSVDASAALNMSGVHTYVSHEDVPGHNKWGTILCDEELFASSSIVYIFMEIEQLQMWARWLELQRDRAIAVLELEQEEEAEGRKHRRRRQMRRKIWMKQWLARRPLYGHYEQLLQELNREDPKGYKNFLRVDADMFGELVDRISPRIQKKNTNFREALEPGLKLAVLCQGQIIGAIVADTQVQAQRAASCVKVQFDELQPIITIKEAIKAGSFHGTPRKLECGDVDRAWKQVEHAIEGESYMGGQEHFYLETHACIAVPKLEDGEMEMFVSTQNPTETQHVAAEVLGVPANRVTVRVKRLGGGFGGKETRSVPFSTVVAVAAQKVGRPVRVMLDRDEDMVMSGTRHPFYAKYKAGFTSEGKIVVLEMEIYNNGGMSMDFSIAVIEKALFHCVNAYKIPNLRVIGRVCKTNISSNTAFRGFGVPQGMMMCEQMLSDIAITLGIPAIKVRELNLYKEGDRTHFGQELKNCQLQRCWEECVKQSNYEARKTQVDIFNSENRWKKRGITMIPTIFGIAYEALFLNQAGALVHIYQDGSVLLTHGGVEMGQGLHTKMMQVASRAMQVPMSKIHISETSTNTVPNTSATAASVSSDLNGMAIINACTTLLERLQPVISENPQGTWEDWVKAAYFQRISLSATGFYKTPGIGFDSDSMTGNPFNYFTFGAACSEVEIDCLTGDHQVLRTDIVMDVGESLNPAIDIGQIEGGFTQGYGLMMMEQQKMSSKGFLFTQGPGTYKIPGFGNIPVEFNVSLLKESNNPKAVYSSKAIGEPPLFLASSVYFATKEAIMSAREDAGYPGNFRLECPATPERVRMACQDQFTAQCPKAPEGSYTPWFVEL